MLGHRLPTLIASTAVAAALACVTAIGVAPANAALGDAYVAIAYSPVSGYAAWANNAVSAQQAAEVALDSCNASGAGCLLAAWAHNGCAALALGSGQWGGDWGVDPATAQARALGKVTAGHIAALHCTS